MQSVWIQPQISMYKLGYIWFKPKCCQSLGIHASWGGWGIVKKHVAEIINKATAAALSWQPLRDKHTQIHEILTDNYLLPYRRVSPSTTERERCKRKICYYVSRESIFMPTSLATLFVYTDTYAHVLSIFILSKGNNTPGCQEITLKRSYGICECKRDVVHISFFHHTYLARQQSVFWPKGGEKQEEGAGRRERERGERVLAEAWQETDSDGQKQGNKLPSKSCTHNSCIRGFPVKVVDAFSPKEQHLCKPKAQLHPHMVTVTVTLPAIHSLTQTHTACNY